MRTYAKYTDSVYLSTQVGMPEHPDIQLPVRRFHCPENSAYEAQVTRAGEARWVSNAYGEHWLNPAYRLDTSERKFFQQLARDVLTHDTVLEARNVVWHSGIVGLHSQSRTGVRIPTRKRWLRTLQTRVEAECAKKITELIRRMDEIQ